MEFGLVVGRVRRRLKQFGDGGPHPVQVVQGVGAPGLRDGSGGEDGEDHGLPSSLARAAARRAHSSGLQLPLRSNTTLAASRSSMKAGRSMARRAARTVSSYQPSDAVETISPAAFLPTSTSPSRAKPLAASAAVAAFST